MPKPSRWFAAASGGTYSVTDASQGRTPGLLQAKEPGGTVTRCGVPALLWTISWELPFDVSADWACPECARLLPTREAANGQGMG
jgi:hypothetical protein